MEQSIPRQLQADLLLIPAAFPRSIPSTRFWVFQELLSQCWVQFKVLCQFLKPAVLCPPATSSHLIYPAHHGLPHGFQLLALGNSASRGQGHLPWNPTPRHCPSEPELGKPQAVLTRLFLFLQGSRPGTSALFSLS